MKTTDDLRALFPRLIKMIANNHHEIGEASVEEDDEGWGVNSHYGLNSVLFDEGGWWIEINYQCCGEWDNDPGDYWTPPCYDLIRAWGEVTEITAYHYDDETDEESEFSEEDLKELYSQIDEVLKDIA